MFKSNKASIEQRIKEIKKELSAVSSDIKTISKSVEKGDFVKIPKTRSYDVSRPVQQAAPAVQSAEARPSTAFRSQPQQALPKDAAAAAQARRDRDPRLADYLSANYDTSVRPLKYERQRNVAKAWIMVAVVVILLFIVLYKFFQNY